jgi:hypothetical protein
VKETDFWSLVKKNLSDRVHVSRIENTAGSGMSDVSACRFPGREVWLELKIQKGNILEFRTSQPVWIDKRLRVGGRVLVLARSDDNIILYHGGVCFGTVDRPPVPVKGKKAVRVVADARYKLFGTSKPFDWRRLEDSIFM